MADNLLLVAWPNGNTIMISPRYTTYDESFLQIVFILLISFPADMYCLLPTPDRPSQSFQAA